MPYAGYPSTFVREAPGGKKAVDHLLWGDYVRDLGERQNGWVRVKGRGGPEGWAKEEEITDQRVLEICFVDIGQGDGSLIIVPGPTPQQDRFILVDAGEGDNMYRFLRWRFNLRPEQEPIRFHAAVITHPDSDHYKGFGQIFDEPALRFGTVYHNGIVERAGKLSLGPVEKSNGVSYLTDVVTDRDGLVRITSDPAAIKGKLYPGLLRSAVQGGRVGDIRMLSAADGHLPGFDGDSPVQIEVLGPVPEAGANGAPRLRLFAGASEPGPTKNGHSVILRLRFGSVTVLLGGDLNIPAENYLLRHYTGRDPEDPAEHEAIVNEARQRFQADVAKACHHGSADFSSVFLRAVNAAATIISSGDDEPHCHPRPDALGAFGKHGRGDRPLIFSTELARSAREQIKNPHVLRATIKELIALRDVTTDAQARARIDEKIAKAMESLDRSIAVYGMINLRTDGSRAVIAQKLEERRAGTGEEWDIHRFETGAGGELKYHPRHKA